MRNGQNMVRGQNPAHYAIPSGPWVPWPRQAQAQKGSSGHGACSWFHCSWAGSPGTACPIPMYDAQVCQKLVGRSGAARLLAAPTTAWEQVCALLPGHPRPICPAPTSGGGGAPDAASRQGLHGETPAGRTCSAGWMGW